MTGRQIHHALRQHAVSPEDLVLAVNREILPALRAVRDALNGLVVIVSADYSVRPQDDVVLVDATDSGLTVTLPDATRYFRRLIVQKVDSSSNPIKVKADSNQTIDGEPSVFLTDKWDTVDLAPITTSSGDGWVRISVRERENTAVYDLEGAAHTMASEHVRSHVRVSHGSACTYTVPPDSEGDFKPGDYVRIIQSGAGTLTFVAGSGVTLNYPETLVSYKQWASFLLVHTNEDDTWDFDGDVELA